MTAQQPYALQNSSHPASIFRSAVHSPWRSPGIVAPGEYAVAAQSTPNMSVQVAGGRAWLLGTQVSDVSGQTFSTQSSYFALNDAPVTVTIATANATNPRIDLVYVAVQDSFYSGSNNNAVIGVVTGTPASSPTVPAAPSNALTLATVAVAANATSVTNSNISNTTTAALQAIARGGIAPVLSTARPTAGLYSGYAIHETDTGRTYVWDTTLGLWDQVGGPPEVYSLTYSTGFADNGSISFGNWQPLRIYKVGRRCWFEGRFQAGGGSPQTSLTAGATYTIGTLPTQVMPILTIDSALIPFYSGGYSWGALLLYNTGVVTFVPAIAGSSGWVAGGASSLQWRTSN